VISGLLISLIPGMPVITLEPDLVFLIFLPPILYAAAWNTSWKDFWKLRRPISLLAFGLVIFTSAAVAVVSHAIIPEFSLAFGFLLGGIISPPDAIAATSVLQGLKVPKRVVTILKVLVQQIDIMETMTPMDFLDFRDMLRPASGFQSYQFKVLEAKLGLKFEHPHGQNYYTSQFRVKKIAIFKIEKM